MHRRPITKFALALLAVCALSFGTFVGCKGSGNTDGGDGTADAGVGTAYVSDGGAGASIRIDVLGSLTTGGMVDFIVTLLDPQGNPLPYIRIFCESESGIAILEPSSGGVAFESTGANGIMSGVLGGVTPGSYLLECRAEQGFNLTARTSILISGDIPSGFNGFPGAAGGNLGGGLLVEEPEEGALTVSAISVTDVNGDGLRIDITQDPDCDNDGNGAMGTIDPEPFTFNNYVISVANGLGDPISIGAVTFTVAGVTSTQEFGTDVPAGSTGTVTGLLTDTVDGGPKQWAGTTTDVAAGTYNVVFTVEIFNLLTGERTVLTDTQVISADFINNC